MPWRSQRQERQLTMRSAAGKTSIRQCSICALSWNRERFINC
jgi:hypothetical protein